MTRRLSPVCSLPMRNGNAAMYEDLQDWEKFVAYL